MKLVSRTDVKVTEVRIMAQFVYQALQSFFFLDSNIRSHLDHKKKKSDKDTKATLF